MKLILAPLFAAASFFGFNATVLTLMRNGLGDAITAVSSGRVPSLNGAPAPFVKSYSGVAAVDDFMATMVLYFSALVDAGPSADAVLFYVWGMAQFGAAWTLLVVEGRRAGNKGRAVAWVAVMGILFQSLSWTFTAPLYLALHLLTSPTARLRNGDGAAARATLLVPDLWDLTVIPLAVVLAFGVPAVLMSFPESFGHTAREHYLWLAFWQPFPTWTMVLIFVFKNVGKVFSGSGSNTVPTARQYLASASGVYSFALLLCVATHLPIMVFAILSPETRSSVLAQLPLLPAGVSSMLRSPELSFTGIFAPYSWNDPPIVNAESYSPGDLAPLAVHFIHYDFYVGTLPLVIWAMYLHQTTVKNPNFGGMLIKTAFWTVVAGPAAAAIALIWSRDQGVLLEGGDGLDRKTK